MSGAPLFTSPNRFACLYNESDNISRVPTQTKDAPLDPVGRAEHSHDPSVEAPADLVSPEPDPQVSPTPPRVRKAGWERKLPKQYTVAVTPGANSLHLPLEIESTDNAIKLAINGLVDCGATLDFVDSEYAAANRLPV